MELHISTTPFGRRPLSRAMIDAQAEAKNADPSAVAHKWRIWRNLAEAKDRLNITDRSLAVLNALLSFHQETALSAGGDLVVFPSNHELTIRAHGMAPTTLRRHLAALVEAGLIIRRDSPNGKRYARKGQGGAIEQAFGFDLAPLVARAAEFEALAEDVRAQRRADALLREQITLLRRDTAKSIEAGLTEGIPAPWADYATQLMGLSQGFLRTFQPPELTARRDALRALYRAVANSLENITKSNKSDANESQDGRHNQNSNSDPVGFEPASRESGGMTGPAPPPPSRTPKAYPLGMVLDACPAIADWSPAPIRDWPEFIRAATVVRSALGVSPSAWEDAVAAMGEPEAAVCVVAILQRAEAIKSPGGYLRALTEKARAGQFSLGPVLMALLRAKLKRRMAGAEIPSPRRRA